MLKFGITERGDASLDFSWVAKMATVDAAVIITKNITDSFIENVLKFKDRVIVHATMTGYGSTIIEPNVPDVDANLKQLEKLISLGFKREQVVVRIDPIIPSPKGIVRAFGVAHKAYKLGFRRFRISIIDMYPHVLSRFRKKQIPNPFGDSKVCPVKMKNALNKALTKFTLQFPGCEFECCAETGISAEYLGCISYKDCNLLGINPSLLVGTKGQRDLCKCPANKIELLENKQQCGHKCLYCYWKKQYKYKRVEDKVITNLSEIEDDNDIYNIFSEALREKDKPHIYKRTGETPKLVLNIDCDVLPEVVYEIDNAVFKNNIALYIVCGKKARLATIDHLYQMINNQIVTLDLSKWDSHYKAKLLRTKKALYTSVELDYRVPVKEASSYNGDFMAECDINEATDVEIREFTKKYFHGNALNIVGNIGKMSQKQRDRYRSMNPVVVFNMTKDETPYVKEAIESAYGAKYHKEDATTYQRYFSKFFKLNKLEITDEVVMYMIDTLTKMCQDYVELASDSAFEFINNFVNINLRYEEYLEINDVLHLPGVVDFVVSDILRERDIDVERFFEDHKDDDFEAINNRYLGDDND